MALATEFKDVWFGQHHPYVSRLGIQVTLDPGPAVTQDHPGCRLRKELGTSLNRLASSIYQGHRLERSQGD